MAFFLPLQNSALLFGLLALQVKDFKFLQTCLSTYWSGLWKYYFSQQDFIITVYLLSPFSSHFVKILIFSVGGYFQW